MQRIILQQILETKFRYQNKLQNLKGRPETILNRERNVTKVENTVLRHEVNPDAEDETTVEKPDTKYAEQILGMHPDCLIPFIRSKP